MNDASERAAAAADKHLARSTDQLIKHRQSRIVRKLQLPKFALKAIENKLIDKDVLPVSKHAVKQLLLLEIIGGDHHWQIRIRKRSFKISSKSVDVDPKPVTLVRTKKISRAQMHRMKSAKL